MKRSLFTFYFVVHFISTTIFNFFVSTLVTLIGLPIVALALLCGTVEDDTGLRRLRRPFLWWDNIFDGALGDPGGDWNRLCLERDGKPATAFSSMWKWLAIRNPANYFGRVILGLDVSEYNFELVAGAYDVTEKKHGWQFIIAHHKITGRLFYCLRFSYPWWFNHKRVFFAWFGHKLSMNQQSVTKESPLRERLIGSVCRINPFKQIK
jgi:hypothetical protein